MSVDRLVLALAGSLVLISLVLSQAHDPAWLWLTAFVGLNMLQASLTGLCPAAWVFKKLGAKPGLAFQ